MWTELEHNDWNTTCISLCVESDQGHDMADCQTGCQSIEKALNAVLTPAVVPDSTLFLELRLQGLGAVYAFCVAVLLSLSIGVWIDHLDDELILELREEHHREKRRERRKRLLPAAEHASAALLDNRAGDGAPLSSLSETSHPASEPWSMGMGGGIVNGGGAAAPPGHRRHQSDGGLSASSGVSINSDASTMLSDMPMLRDSYIDEDNIDLRYGIQVEEVDGRFGTNQPNCSTQAWLVHCMHVVLCLVLLASLLCMQFSPNFERSVTGGLPDFLRLAGIDFDSSLTMWDIPSLTAQEGGLDYLMAATFVTFVLIGPLLRVLSLLVLLLVPLRMETQRFIYLWSRRLVAYTGVEVMIIATPLIGEAFGPISESLLNPDVLPFCKPVSYVFEPETRKCLRIDIYPMVGYWFNVAAVVMLCVSGFDGSLTSKYIHRRLWPLDPHPPPSCIECCAKTKATVQVR